LGQNNNKHWWANYFGKVMPLLTTLLDPKSNKITAIVTFLKK